MAPWGYAAAGLGQGALEGFMLGAEMKERRRRAKQEQQREALMMLYPAIKQDPAALKQLEPFMQQMLGPQFKMPDIKPPEQQEQQAITQRMEFLKQKMPWLKPQELSLLSMGYAPPKATEEKPIAFFHNGQYAGHFKPSEVDAESGLTPQRPWKPATGINVVPLGPGELPAPGHYPPGTRFPRLPGSQGGKAATESGLTPAQDKQMALLEDEIRNNPNLKERQKQMVKYAQKGGSFQFGPDGSITFNRNRLAGGGGPQTFKVRNKKTGQMEEVDEETYNAIKAAQGK